MLGKVSFDAVSFGYGNSAPILDKVSFEIGAGEHVAVVGASGAGKSTLANLLLRFYDPQGGSVRVDGTDLRDYKLNSLRDQIAIVLQEAVLFQASVRDNIAYGRIDADDAAIVRAAAIARAVVRDAPILVLDEPLTGLDTHSKTVVRAALSRLQRGRSTLHITHDLESVANADRVLFLDQGRAAGFDHHAVLLRSNRAYLELWNLENQFEAVIPLREVAL